MKTQCSLAPGEPQLQEENLARVLSGATEACISEACIAPLLHHRASAATHLGRSHLRQQLTLWHLPQPSAALALHELHTAKLMPEPNRSAALEVSGTIYAEVV